LNVLPNPLLGPGVHLAIGATNFPPTNTIGSGLNPTADFLALVFRNGAADQTIDVVNWGSPNPNWPNYSRFGALLWTVNTPTMPTNPGQSLQRFPDGWDTDQPSDWVVMTASPGQPPPPTPTPTGTATNTATSTPTPGAASPTATATV